MKYITKITAMEQEKPFSLILLWRDKNVSTILVKVPFLAWLIKSLQQMKLKVKCECGLFLFSNHGLEVTCQFKPFFKAFASDSHTVGQFGTFRKVSHWHQKISGPNEFNKLSLGSIWHSDSVCQSTTGPSTCQVEDRKAHKCFPGSEKNSDISDLRLSFGRFHQGNAA